MGHLVLLVLDDMAVLPALLEAWQSIGVSGVTILQSAGAYRTQKWLRRMGLSALDRLFDSEETSRRTLLTAVEEEAILERAIAEAERLVGGFDRPGSGLLLVLPVSRALGLHKVSPMEVDTRPYETTHIGWLAWRNKSAAEIARLFDLRPVIVRRDTALDQIPRALMAQPEVQVVCVTSEEDVLVGLLPLSDLADALLFYEMPEEFLSEVTDLEGVVEFAKHSYVRTVADVMKPPVWVRQDDPVKLVFKRMHQHQLPGLPVVNETYHIIGYISLLALLLAIYCQPYPPQEERGIE
ncbi:MAG: CBS domain-containing protein [Anaerolineae bacterium]